MTATITEGERFTAAAGTAVELIISGDVEPAQTATVASWFLDCPGQSPAWSHYLLSIIHLRPIDGVPPATVTAKGATHEVMLLALDPQLCPTATVPATWRRLTPTNLVEQIELPDDAAAVGLLRLAVRAVVDGRLWAEPPLSGQVEPWRSVLQNTAAHFRGEHD